MFGNVSIDVLGNGITVIADPVPHVRTVATSIVMGTGSFHDPENRQGIAHKSEHMADYGVPGMSSIEFARFAEKLGIYSSANLVTTGQYTEYYARARTPNVWDYMDMLAKSLVHLDFTPKDVEIETGRIVNEMKGCMDSPEELERIFHLRAAYGQSAYSRMDGGTVEHLKDISYDEILDFYSRNFVGRNIRIYASGNVTRDGLREWAQTNFGHLRAGSTVPKIHCPFMPEDLSEHVSWRARTTSVNIVHNLPQVAHRNPYIAHFANYMLNQRLKAKVENRIGMYHASSSTDFLSGRCGMNTIECNPDDDAQERDIDVIKTVNAICRIARDMTQETTARRFEEQKAAFLAMTQTNEDISAEDTQERRETLISNFEEHEDDDFNAVSADMINAITLDTVQGYWHELFGNTPGTCYIRPEREKGNRSYPKGADITDMMGITAASPSIVQMETAPLKKPILTAA